MLKKILIISTLSIILLFIFSALKINSDEDYQLEKFFPNISLNTLPSTLMELSTPQSDTPIGKIIISKLNINHNLFSIDSKDNTIDKNITILKGSIFPNQNNSIMFIAAHSGTGKLAYFKNLNLLEVNDEVILEFDNIKYYYKVTDIWEEKKTGYINVSKSSKNQLVLTTCSPNKDNYQLIINCLEKET